jgi:hypothetical protein
VQRQIHIALLEEGTKVWRPVQAEHLGNDLFRVLGIVPSGEAWQFQPGEVVRCVEQQLSGAQCLVAVARGAAVALTIRSSGPLRVGTV